MAFCRQFLVFSTVFLRCKIQFPLLTKFILQTKVKYNKKISEIQPLSILERYLSYSKIKVAQVKDSKNKFQINLEEVTRLKTQNNCVGIGFLSIFGLLHLYLSIGNYNAYRKSLQNAKNTNQM